MKSTVVDESLSSFKPMYCSREYQASTRSWIQLMTQCVMSAISTNYQLVLYIRSVLANLQHLLSYIRAVSLNITDCIEAAMTGTLSTHILPITDLKQMLSHIEETLPSTMHLPVSSEDTLHFYRYLHALFLIANWQFLLLIDVPIQD